MTRRRESASSATSPKPRRTTATKASRPGPNVDRSQKARSPREPAYLATVRNFETAVRYFQKENYRKAAEIFEKLTSSPAREVADRARVHLHLCEQKLRHNASEPRTAEEHYLRGIAALNSRELDLAIEHLSKSGKMQPNREHVHYALAATYALQGAAELSLKHLQSAIQLRPGNRIQARKDEDFQGLAGHPKFQQLLNARAG